VQSVKPVNEFAANAVIYDWRGRVAFQTGVVRRETAIAFAKVIGASSALCKKCTRIEKAKRGFSDSTD